MAGKTNIYFHEAAKIEVKVDHMEMNDKDKDFYTVVSVEVTSPDGDSQKIDVFGVRNSKLETVGVERNG